MWSHGENVADWSHVNGLKTCYIYTHTRTHTYTHTHTYIIYLAHLSQHEQDDFAMCVTVLRKLRELCVCVKERECVCVSEWVWVSECEWVSVFVWFRNVRPVLRKLRELWSRLRHKCQNRTGIDLLRSKRDPLKCQKRSGTDLLRGKRDLLTLCCESCVSCVKRYLQRDTLCTNVPVRVGHDGAFLFWVNLHPEPYILN